MAGRMDILFRNAKLRKACSQSVLASRKWGTEGGRKVMRRLDEMADSENMAVLTSLRQTQCHPLKGDRRGQFSVDLAHPYRLIFEPANEPLPKLPDGGLDLQRVTVVRILSVEDTHG